MPPARPPRASPARFTSFARAPLRCAKGAFVAAGMTGLSEPGFEGFEGWKECLGWSWVYDTPASCCA